MLFARQLLLEVPWGPLVVAQRGPTGGAQGMEVWVKEAPPCHLQSAWDEVTHQLVHVLRTLLHHRHMWSLMCGGGWAPLHHHLSQQNRVQEPCSVQHHNQSHHHQQ